MFRYAFIFLAALCAFSAFSYGEDLEKVKGEDAEEIVRIVTDALRECESFTLEVKKTAVSEEFFDEVEKMIEFYGLSDRVTCVVDNVGFLEVELLQCIQERFKKKKNYAHVFIMSTGDLVGMLHGVQMESNILRDSSRSFDISRLLQQEGSVFYAFALEKRGNAYNCYIVDASVQQDHINNPKYSIRDINR